VPRSLTCTAAFGVAPDDTMGRPAPWPPPAAGDDSLEILDPAFAFLVGVVEHDLLGVWTGEEIRAFVAASGRSSRLPVDHLQRVERRPARGSEVHERRGARVERIWILTLDREIHLPMPYSIFGYHPGSLLIARNLVLSEWDLGHPILRTRREGKARVCRVTGLRALRIDSGWVAMDVDAWLDRLLGNRLDDAWSEGLVLCRVQGRLHGLTAARNRRRRPIFGGFDFRNDQVLAEGQPLVRSLSRYARPWLAPPAGQPKRYWRFEPCTDLSLTGCSPGS